MCGGSAPNQVQKTEWNNELGPRWVGTFTNAEAEVNRPYQRYPGGANARFAGLTGNQLRGIGNMDQFTTALNSPTGAMNAGVDQIEQTARGDYLGANPYGGANAEFNPWEGVGAGSHRNAFRTAANEYGGMDSPYYKQMQQNVASEMADAYKLGTSADTTRMFNLAGAFGGSAHQNAVANNEGAFAKQLGNTLAGMNADQYTRSAGLKESEIGRGFQADEAILNRGNDNFQRGLDRGFQGFEGERGRQMQSVGLGQNENANVLARIQGLMSTGQVAQDQNQRQHDFDYDQWSGEQNYNWNQIRNYADLLSRSMGGGAGVNSSIYGSSGSGTSQALGGLLAAYGLMK